MLAMGKSEKPFEIRFYKDEMFDEEQLLLEAATNCHIDEMTCSVILDNHNTEQTGMTSGTPSFKWDVTIGSLFYAAMKYAFTEDSGNEYLKFHVTVKLRTSEVPKKVLEEKHTFKVKNPLFEVKREDWPEWEDPKFDIPVIVRDEVKEDDFTISVSPQYTAGDMFDFLDETQNFDLVVISVKKLKKIDVTAQLMHEWRKEKLSAEVSAEAQSHVLKIELSANLLDQVKELGSYSHSESEKFNYSFEIEMTDAEDKKHRRTVSVQLPNPYYEGIKAEKQIAREALAEVFQRKYGEDIAELKLEGQPGWWRWNKHGASFQYGWKDEAIVLYRYFGALDYDADEDEVSRAMQELTEFADGAGEFVYIDNYFVLKYEFSPEWMDAENLEKKLDEFEKFADSEEVAKFLAAHEGES